MKYQMDDEITIGLVKFTVLLTVDVDPSDIFLTQEGVIQILSISDKDGTLYTTKVYGIGKFSSPKKMKTQK